MSTTTTTWTRPSDGRVFRADHTPRPFFVRARSAQDRYYGTEAGARRYLASLANGGQVFFDYAPGTGTLVTKTGAL